MTEKFEETFWAEAIKLASPHFYALVTSVDKNGRPNVMGLSWWMFTSVNPPLAAIAVGQARYSHQCLEGCKEFVLCFPSEAQKDGAWFCGTKSGRNYDKFKESGLKAVPATKVSPPLIEGAMLAFECKVVQELDVGDHTIYVGEIVAMHKTPGVEKHLYTIAYSSLLSIDNEGNVDISG